jgi:hypothetical protein
MFNFTLNNMIDASAGLALLQLSFSGFMCPRSSGSSRSSESGNSQPSGNCQSRCVSMRNSCSMANLNLGLSAAGVTGALLLYRGLRR